MKLTIRADRVEIDMDGVTIEDARAIASRVLRGRPPSVVTDAGPEPFEPPTEQPKDGFRPRRCLAGGLYPPVAFPAGTLARADTFIDHAGGGREIWDATIVEGHSTLLEWRGVLELDPDGDDGPDETSTESKE